MILNRQRTVRVARPQLELFLRRVREQLGLNGAEIAICLVSDTQIARMNECFRNKKGPTDVLSFPANTRSAVAPRLLKKPGSTALLHPEGQRAAPKPVIQKGVLAPEVTFDFLGDIAIAPATARRNARKYKRTLPDELQILILHGVLHLLGYDHETDRGQMTRIENRLRRKLGLA
jgi:probable rRNA maturation factor